MEKRLNFNRKVDDLTKINEFFQTGGHPVRPALSRLRTSRNGVKKTKTKY